MPLRRKFLLTALWVPTLLCLGQVPMAAAQSQSPVGVWRAPNHKTGELESLIEIFAFKGKLYGKIVKLIRDPKAKCEGCEGEDKGRSLLGMVIMWDYERDGDTWSSGEILDPKTGKTYRSKMWVDDSGALRVRAYLGPFYQTESWQRK